MLSHKEWIKSTFNRAAPTYGQRGCAYFDYFGKRLVDYAQLRAGERLLDVACGKGAVLLPAWEKGAQVTGIDLSPQMLEEAKKRVPSQVSLLEMDAEHLNFPDQAFDVVFCAFGLFFFPDIQAALSQMRRVLKPGGRLVVSVWGEKTPLEIWTAQRAQALGATRRLRTMELDTQEKLKELLASPVVIKEERKVFFYPNAEYWWESLWAHGTRSYLEQLSLENLALLRTEALAQAGKGKVAQERHAIFGLSRK